MPGYRTLTPGQAVTFTYESATGTLDDREVVGRVSSAKLLVRPDPPASMALGVRRGDRRCPAQDLGVLTCRSHSRNVVEDERPQVDLITIQVQRAQLHDAN